MGRKTAPGYHELTTEIRIKAWPVVKERVLDMMNRAMRQVIFPAPWKKRIVRILYKGQNKDP